MLCADLGVHRQEHTDPRDPTRKGLCCPLPDDTQGAGDHTARGILTQQPWASPLQCVYPPTHTRVHGGPPTWRQVTLAFARSSAGAVSGAPPGSFSSQASPTAHVPGSSGRTPQAACAPWRSRDHCFCSFRLKGSQAHPESRGGLQTPPLHTRSVTVLSHCKIEQ